MTTYWLAFSVVTIAWLTAMFFAHRAIDRRLEREISRVLRSPTASAPSISEYERQKDRFLEAGPPNGSVN